MILRHGGVTEVPITRPLLQAVSQSSSKYYEEQRKEREEKKKAEKANVDEAEATRKRKAEEAEMLSWREKRINLQQKIKASETHIASQEDIAQVTLTLTFTLTLTLTQASLKKCQDLKSTSAVKTSAMAAELARKAIRKEQEKVKKFNEQLLEYSSKRPKGS